VCEVLDMTLLITICQQEVNHASLVNDNVIRENRHELFVWTTVNWR